MQTPTPTITPCICPICGKNIRVELLMCGTHWVRVPQSNKVKVGQAWRRYQARETATTFAALRAAQVEAVLAHPDYAGAA